MKYFSSNKAKEKEISCKIKNDAFSTIEELYDKLNSSGWCEMSVFSHKQWNVNNKCCGQCNATVLLVQEYFGGEIILYDNPPGDKGKHFFNRIDGVDIDLTSGQFASMLNYSSKTQNANFNGKTFEYKKSEYILKLRLGL